MAKKKPKANIVNPATTGRTSSTVPNVFGNFAPGGFSPVGIMTGRIKGINPTLYQVGDIFIMNGKRVRVTNIIQDEVLVAEISPDFVPPPIDPTLEAGQAERRARLRKEQHYSNFIAELEQQDDSKGNKTSTPNGKK